MFCILNDLHVGSGTMLNGRTHTWAHAAPLSIFTNYKVLIRSLLLRTTFEVNRGDSVVYSARIVVYKIGRTTL